ncbi:AAA domain-containing protein [Duganella sp. Root198D2]|uniref:AAA domain-containing protein n=1 Tax=Duganella sp. Root198D2 TaxID=1736489 RepID=UPI00070FD03B|nr:AAA domain-containing protein [Duganella sp. Root198D2]KRB92453.1 helicase [Duganella sp. Root198D2]
MVSIFVDDVDRTRQVKDWKIWRDTKEKKLVLTCYFHSGKSFHYPLGKCRIQPTVKVDARLLSRAGGSVFNAIDSAEIYGGRYAVVRYAGNPNDYVWNASGITLSSVSSVKEGPVFRYLADVAQARIAMSAPADRPITENILRQLEKLPAHEDSVLDAYCSGQWRSRQPDGELIYPFGVNESQLQAVEQAFTSQASLVEGPPGTGKTQTILNIVANIVLRGKTVAILSNNNAAVDNVYEKLAKVDLDWLVARLGSQENRHEFFKSLAPVHSCDPAAAPSMEQIQICLRKLSGLLQARGRVARLTAEIDEINIELRYLQQWQEENEVMAPLSVTKYKLSPGKSTDLMAYLACLEDKRLRIKDRIELLLNFRILRMKPFDNLEKRKAVIYALQRHFYEELLRMKGAELDDCQQALDRGNFEALLEELSAGSMLYLKQQLARTPQPPVEFDAKTYRKDFDAFLKRFPVLGSSTHSIVNSLAPGTILDYVIIDEASQQDIVPGILALGCARNLIIVGDRKQLPHIPAKTGLAAPAEFYDCDRYSLLDSCIGVFGSAMPMTLLKEHYRCHPRIIQFCNQQFYDNQLVPMTLDSGEKPLRLIVTAKGNHERRNANRRELDSFLETLDWSGPSDWDGANSRGFIAPFKAQVSLSRGLLPSDFVKETVHKFQGRECDEIVFSTVLDKKTSGSEKLAFVDDPHLVNVAVSRARERFTLVTGDGVFSGGTGHVAALLRYMEYYADVDQVYRAPVVSAFDLLYEEYDQSLERLNDKLRDSDSKFKSERIVAAILRHALKHEAHQTMKFHSQVPLIQLVASSRLPLTPREKEFIRNRASCDFVLYFKVGKAPLGVIEVDGGSHDLPHQAELDALKDSILKKYAIPILRLKTVESEIEEKVGRFLFQWARGPSGDACRKNQ